ncbi:unnamed protein product [Discosporangium mesarthrocarpum]
MSSIPKFTLTYFDIPGPAEAIRLAFYISGISFEDRRIDREEFTRIKLGRQGTQRTLRQPLYLPFGQLPLLEVDGESFPQSAAILRFVGKLGGLYPSDPIKAAKCDAVIDGMIDIQAAIRPSIYETNPLRKFKLRDELSKVTLPLWLGHLERWLEGSGGPFFLGDELTTCDLVIYTRMKWLRRGVLVGIPGDILDTFPKIFAHSNAVNGHPKVIEYYTHGPGKVTGDGTPPLLPPQAAQPTA